MAKFIMLKDYVGLDEIKDYMNKNQEVNYYIAPNLLHEFLGDMRYRCVVGLSMYEIKIKEYAKFDLLTTAVYNRVFEADTFRIEAVKDGTLKRIPHNIRYDFVIFGLKGDLRNFGCCDVEELN